MARLLLSALLVLVCVTGAQAVSCSSNADCTNTGETCSGSACACDTTNHFTGSAGSCTCATTYALKSDKTCGKVVGQACSSPSDCVDNAVCTSSLCACASSATAQTDGTCKSGASTVVSALLLLVTSLVASTRLA